MGSPAEATTPARPTRWDTPLREEKIPFINQSHKHSVESDGRSRRESARTPSPLCGGFDGARSEPGREEHESENCTPDQIARDRSPDMDRGSFRDDTESMISTSDYNSRGSRYYSRHDVYRPRYDSRSPPRRRPDVYRPQYTSRSPVRPVRVARGRPWENNYRPTYRDRTPRRLRYNDGYREGPEPSIPAENKGQESQETTRFDPSALVGVHPSRMINFLGH